MSIAPISNLGGASVGLANAFLAGSLGPGSLRRIGGGTGVEPAIPARASESIQPARGGRDDRDGVVTTAYQRSADGDEAFLSSRLGSLSEKEQRQVRELQARDREVRIHEQAHVAAAGSLYRGGPTYDFQRGPDGKRYAVGGSVQIDTSPGSTPEETIAKAQQMRRAALAPAEPSSTDRAVAASAARLEAEARAELAASQASGAGTPTSPVGQRADAGDSPAETLASRGIDLMA